MSRGEAATSGPADPVAPMAAAVEAWFRAKARSLPWRTSPRDPWASLVSEVMAQQTQIARVVERFPAFMERFPTPGALAAADEQEVLGLWQGMGYYRRARLLHQAARAIVDRHGGNVPASLEELLALPGIGRYTGGAIASIALGQRAPIVDGNVARVLLRVHGREGRAGERETDAWCWERAGVWVRSATDPASCNEGLMELGATVCVPRGPRCGECPLAGVCIAQREGAQDRIPTAKVRGPTPRVVATVIAATDGRGQVLVEQRGIAGMWGAMWQLPTLETDGEPGAAAVRGHAGGAAGRVRVRFEHQTTHRLFEFRVRRVEADAARRRALSGPGRRWVSRGRLAELPMSNPQRRIVEALGLLG